MQRAVQWVLICIEIARTPLHVSISVFKELSPAKLTLIAQLYIPNYCFVHVHFPHLQGEIFVHVFISLPFVQISSYLF